MNYRVIVGRAASKILEDLPPELQRRIADRLLALEANPYQGSRKLEGRDGYRVRVGDYRILFRVDESRKVVSVRRIGHRRDVYR